MRAQDRRMWTGRRVAVLGALAGALLLLAAAGPSPAQAAPGDLDLGFSGDGKKTTNFAAPGLSSASATVRQPDGKIVAVGADRGHGSADFALARYNPDGSLDTSFSGNGKQTTDFGGGDEAAGVALQDDGKIVVAGTTTATGEGDFALARYNPDGSLDTSFSGDGRQTTSVGGTNPSYENSHAFAVAVQGDGKIVAAGHARFFMESLGSFALARYNPNGTLDATFSGDGMQTTAFGGPPEVFASAKGVMLQGDGKIVAVGDAEGDFALARYNPNGSLDASFSGDGIQTTTFGRPIEGAREGAIQGNGRIVAVGGTANGFGLAGDFALARYNPDGSLDASFSGDGKQTTDFGGTLEGASGVAIQGTGKIIAVGRAGDTAGDFALARYNPNGTLDSSFSGDGKQTTDFFGNSDVASGVTLQGDGKIVVAGNATRGPGEHFALARYSHNGTLDTSFSGDGRQTTDFGGFGQDGVTGVALQGDGKIVAVGSTGRHPSSDFALARYNPDGSLDTSFSGDGRQTTDFGGLDTATGVALQGDGKIVVVGRGDARDFALARYNPNGTLDPSFSGDGKQTTDFFGGIDEATGVALQGDGKMVVVGRARRRDFALARYNPNGSLDASFSGDGKQTTDFFGGSDGARGVVIQDDGKIVAVGLASGGATGNDFALARYNPNGSLDTTFSSDGKRATDFFGGSDGARAVVLQGGGKIVAVGAADTGGPDFTDFALARYNPDGSLDTTFSGDGKQTTGFQDFDAANGVALQGDGKIVVAGVAGTGGSDFALARYSPNGSLDASFSGDGKQTTDFFGGLDEARGVALQGDGKIVAVGDGGLGGTGGTGTGDFALARYLGG